MAADALQPLNSRKWDEKKAKHLLSRAGFGIPRERVTHLAQIGLDKAVDALVEHASLDLFGNVVGRSAELSLRRGPLLFVGGGGQVGGLSVAA